MDKGYLLEAVNNWMWLEDVKWECVWSYVRAMVNWWKLFVIALWVNKFNEERRVEDI